MADNPLTRLPLLGQLLVVALLAAALGGAFWYFIYDGMLAEEKTKSARLGVLQADIRNLEVIANKLDEFRREVAAREQKLETLRRILPAEKQTADLMKRVQYLASQSNLLIRKFTPGPTIRREFELEAPPAAAPAPGAPGAKPPAPARPPARPGAPGAPGAAQPPGEYYQEWPINVEVEGNYHNMGTFFDRVSRLSRIVTLGGVKMKGQTKPTASNTISTTCVATTYVYVEGPAEGQTSR